MIDPTDEIKALCEDLIPLAPIRGFADAIDQWCSANNAETISIRAFADLSSQHRINIGQILNFDVERTPFDWKNLQQQLQALVSEKLKSGESDPLDVLEQPLLTTILDEDADHLELRFVIGTANQPLSSSEFY